MKTIEVVAGVIQFEDKYLCIQRGASKFEYIHHKYEFPGGKIEAGESEEQALLRELMEELNIEIKSVIKKLKIVDHQYPDFRLIMHPYLCEPMSNNIQLKEHIDFKWLSVYDIHNLDWAAADLPIVTELQNEL